MTDTIDTTPKEGSIYEIPQQLLGGEDAPEEIMHALARACVVHCAAAAVNKEHAPSVDELRDFVLEHGAGSGSDLYTEGIGWNVIGVAELLRHQGYSVISQNLNYAPGDTNIKQATEAGRIRSDFEKERMVLLSEYGGPSRQNWAEAIKHSRAFGGKVIASIQIPLISGNGFGTHAVLVQDIDDDTVTYFDPDHYNLTRFGQNKPAIEKIHETELIYKRPLGEFLGAMTGELMHIYPSTAKVETAE